jgi:ribosomal protein S18 acetylase RimI-like enzyme
MVKVRPAVPADAAQVVRVNVRTWQHAYAGIIPDSVLAAMDDEIEDRVRLTGERLSTGGPFVTVVATGDSGPATCERGLVGFTTYGPYRPEGGGTDPAHGEVLAIYVDPDHQGRGAGRALLDAAVTALRATGAGSVRLWVLEDNTPSRRFYERYGFATDGVRHHYRVRQPDGTPVDLPEVRYAMPLR